MPPPATMMTGFVLIHRTTARCPEASVNQPWRYYPCHTFIASDRDFKFFSSFFGSWLCLWLVPGWVGVEFFLDLEVDWGCCDGAWDDVVSVGDFYSWAGCDVFEVAVGDCCGVCAGWVAVVDGVSAGVCVGVCGSSGFGVGLEEASELRDVGAGAHCDYAGGEFGWALFGA